MANPFDQFAMPMGPPPPAAPYGPPPVQSQPFMDGPPQGAYGAPPPYGGPPGQQLYSTGAAPSFEQQPPPQQLGNPYTASYGQLPQYPPQGPPGGPFGAPQEQPAYAPSMAPPDEGNPFGAPAPAPAYDNMMAPPPQMDQSYGQPHMPTEQPPPMPYGQPPPMPDLANPFGAAAPESHPPAPQPSAAYADPWGAPQQQQQQQQPYPMQDSSLYGAPPPASQSYGAPPPPSQSYGAPPQSYGAPPPPSQSYGAPPSQVNPYGLPPGQPENPDPSMGALALVPSQHQSNPYATNLYGQPPVPYGQPPNPYGQPYQQPYPPAQPPAPPVDPFSVFEASTQLVVAPPSQLVLAPPGPSYSSLPPLEAAPLAAAPQPNPSAPDDDFWGAFSVTAPAPAPEESKESKKATPSSTVSEEKKGEDGLPPGGEWYDAKIFTPTLGVMFFKPQELTDSLFLNTDRNIVDALGERPVVAFIVEGSSARSAGVELGHVLLKVNGVDVKNPKDASRLIKEGPRPLPLLFYVPNTDVVVAEGEHMVKYDTRDTTAPNSAKEWKPKYVVIGGIIAQPWMMNMYRSKSEYDIAVIETQARRPVSVKVKQFSLQGARIQNDWQGPQMVKYKNKLQPWKYIVVLPVARNPIKISSPNLSQLKPVHEGIRRVLLAQQRERGSSGRGSGSRSGYDQGYDHGGGDSGGRAYDHGGGSGGYDNRPPYRY